MRVIGGGTGRLAEFRHCNVLQTVTRSLDFALRAVGHHGGFLTGVWSDL